VTEQSRTRALWVLAAVSGSAASRAQAHEASANALNTAGLGLGLNAWTNAWWLWLGLGLAVLAYTLGQLRLYRRLGAIPRGSRFRSICFGLFVITTVLALLSPLDAWSDALFSAHMLQHELLMLIAAPLFVFARPFESYFWALPSSARQRVLALVRKPVCVSAFAWLTAPAVALLVHGLTRWIWHLPFLFEACLANETLHGVQHASFFVTALAFWWALAQGGYGKIGYGVSVLFVFATAMHTGALGALISLAHEPWYSSYTRRAARLGIDALGDQRLAGLIMWVVAGGLFTALALALFAAWLGEARRRSLRTSLASLIAAEERHSP
jgi:putative membrane protein